MTAVLPPGPPPPPSPSGGDESNELAFHAFVHSNGAMDEAKKRADRSVAKTERTVHRHGVKAAAANGKVTVADVATQAAVHDYRTAQQDVDDDERLTERGRQWMSRPLALLIGVAAVVGLWFVDSTLLLGLRLGLFETRLLTLVVVAASALAAWGHGTTGKTVAMSTVPAVEVPGAIQRRRLFLGLGLGIEILLAAIRAIFAQALLSSLLLGLAGVAIWFAISYAAGQAHDGPAIVVKRCYRGWRRAARRSVRCRKVAAKHLNRFDLAQRNLQSAAERGHMQALGVLQASHALWTRAHPPAALPTESWLVRLEALANGTFPECCRRPQDGLPAEALGNGAPILHLGAGADRFAAPPTTALGQGAPNTSPGPVELDKGDRDPH